MNRTQLLTETTLSTKGNNFLKKWTSEIKYQKNMEHFVVGTVLLEQNINPFLNTINAYITSFKTFETNTRGLVLLVIDAGYVGWEQIILMATKDSHPSDRVVLNEIFLTIAFYYPHIKKTKLKDGTFTCQL